MEHFNQLTPGEAERLALLLEELGETQQVIGKILRFGYERHGNGPHVYKNRKDLEREIAHVLLAINIMIKKGDLSEDRIHHERQLKMISIGKWLNHQEPDQGE